MSKCKNIVITGSNRGIGLEMVKQLVRRFKPDNLFATYRNSAKSEELLDLAAQNENIHAVVLDVRDTYKYRKFVSQIEAKTKVAVINLLINNAGVYTKENNTTLSQLKKDDLMYLLEVNAVAPIMLTQALLPLLKKASQANSGVPLGIGRAAVLQISSYSGSIGGNTRGRSYGYRISKTALNQASKTMSIDLLGKGILVIPLHPGWVKTDMGTKTKTVIHLVSYLVVAGSDAEMSPEKSVSGILKVLEQLNEKNTGHFMRFDGKEVQW